MEEGLCGEVARTGGDGTSRLTWRRIGVAIVAGWTVRSVLIVAVGIAGGCGHTSVARGPDDCGTFSSTVVGVPPFYTPAGQYATYASACGAERFSRIVATQRTAIVAGANAAVGGGRDAVARDAIARTQRDVLALAGAVEGIASADGVEAEGGAR